MQTRKLLLASTREILKSVSFEKFDLRSVARHSGTTRRTIYNQFSSKEDLYRTSREELVFDLAKQVVDAVPERMEPVDGLRYIGCIAHEVFNDPRNTEIIGSIKRDGTQFPWLINLYETHVLSPLLSACEVFILRATRRRPIAPDQPRLIAEQYLGTMDAMAARTSMILSRRPASVAADVKHLDIISTAYAAIIADTPP